MTDVTAARPRIRSGAIVWGIIVCSIGATVIATVSSRDARDGFADWVGAMPPSGLAVLALLILGLLILVLSGLAMIRRAQRRIGERAASRAAASTDRLTQEPTGTPLP